MTSHDDASANDPQVPNDDEWLNDAARWWSSALSKAGAGFRRRLDQDAKRRTAPEPIPLSDFDRDFQELVPAKLEGYVRLSAYLVSLELETFEVAKRRVMRAARKYGALHLSDQAFYELSSWIDQQILACIDEPAPDGLVGREALARIMRECP